jgi:predicted dehydrogenase
MEPVMLNQRIGIALIGLGPAAQPHAKSLVDLASQVDVIWAVGRHVERGHRFIQQYPFPFTTEIMDALTDPRVNAVFVLTPPNTHLEISSLAFGAGKHVLLEKPLDITITRGEKIIAAARAANRRLGIVLQHRFRPASVRLKQLLKNHELGEVEAASLSVPWWRPQSYYDEAGRGRFDRDGGGVLLTQAIHAVDLFRDLLGVKTISLSRVKTTSIHAMESEDLVMALATLANGAPAMLYATTAAYPGFPERIEIIGTSGTAHLVGGALTVDYCDGRKETVRAEGKSGSGAAIMDFSHEAHRSLIIDFLDAIAADRDPTVTGEDALATQQLIASIIRADPENRHPV